MANKYTAYRFVDDTHKECSKCGQIKPHSEFHKDKNTRHRNLAFYCKLCANENSRKNHRRRLKEQPEYKVGRKRSYIKARWQMSLEAYEELIQSQDSRCAICKVSFSEIKHSPNLDHCHKTNKIREFLCNPCNQALGYAKDNKDILMNMIEYLNKHTSNAALEERADVHE